jgi:methylmalonyl-CoA/ethylmalonyl-CoA epimerase
MPSIRRIHHVAIVVEDIDQSLIFWRDILGLELSRLEEVQDQEARVAFLPVGESELELVSPTTSNSGIARFLEKRGSGMHHFCFEVDDIEAILDKLKQNNIKLINESPVVDSDKKKFAFIHPESTHGVLIELYEIIK